MKQTALLAVLLCIAAVTQAQALLPTPNVDPKAYTYNSMAEALSQKHEEGAKFSVMENGIISEFTYVDTTKGFHPDGGIIVGVPNTHWAAQRTTGNTHDVFPEWWGAIADGTTNNRNAIQSAINYLAAHGGGCVHFGSGLYMADSITMKANIMIRGASNYSYGEDDNNANTEGATRIRLVSGSGYLFLANSIANIGFYDLTLDGINGENTRVGNAIRCNSATFAISIHNAKLYHFYIAFAGNNCWDVKMNTVILRNNYIGAHSFRDSDLSDITLSSNRGVGVYLNNGQVKIDGGFAEWDRLLPDSAATAIYLDGNCSRIQILNMKFDRNAGNDIVGKAFNGKSPFLVDIHGCQFKRAGWGSNLATIDRAAIEMISCTNVNISGNTFWSAGSGAGGTTGLFSPEYALRADNTTGLTFVNNNFIANKQKIDISFDSTKADPVQWLQSAANSSEWYLQAVNKRADNTFNPWYGQPDIIGWDTAQLASVAGTLAVGQWAWKDADALGYSAIYVRLTGDRNPNTIGQDSFWAYFDHQAYYCPGVTHFQTDEFRDWIPNTTLNSGQSVSFWVYTNAATGTSSANAYILRVSAREAFNVNYGIADIPIAVKREFGGIAQTVVQGFNQPLSDLEMGTSAAYKLQINTKADVIGSRIKVTFTNNGTNAINFNGRLLW